MSTATVQIDPDTGFFASAACRSGDHCRTCRDRQAGQAFRTAIAAKHNLDGTDFDCPHARPWGVNAGLVPILSRPRASSHSLPPAVPFADPAMTAEAKRRFAICKACEHSRDNGFACAMHKGCCFGRWRSDLENVCPKGRW